MNGSDWAGIEPLSDAPSAQDDFSSLLDPMLLEPSAAVQDSHEEASDETNITAEAAIGPISATLAAPNGIEPGPEPGSFRAVKKMALFVQIDGSPKKIYDSNGNNTLEHAISEDHLAESTTEVLGAAPLTQIHQHDDDPVTSVESIEFADEAHDGQSIPQSPATEHNVAETNGMTSKTPTQVHQNTDTIDPAQSSPHMSVTNEAVTDPRPNGGTPLQNRRHSSRYQKPVERFVPLAIPKAIPRVSANVSPVAGKSTSPPGAAKAKAKNVTPGRRKSFGVKLSSATSPTSSSPIDKPVGDSSLKLAMQLQASEFGLRRRGQ